MEEHARGFNSAHPFQMSTTTQGRELLRGTDSLHGSFLIRSGGKRLSASAEETEVRSHRLGRVPWKQCVTLSSALAWKIMHGEAWWATVHGYKVGTTERLHFTPDLLLSQRFKRIHRDSEAVNRRWTGGFSVHFSRTPSTPYKAPHVGGSSGHRLDSLPC